MVKKSLNKAYLLEGGIGVVSPFIPMNLSGKSGDWNTINKDPKRFVEEYDFNQSNLKKIQFGQLQTMPMFAQAELSESFYKRYSANVPRLIRCFAVMHLFACILSMETVCLCLCHPQKESLGFGFRKSLLKGSIYKSKNKKGVVRS